MSVDWYTRRPVHDDPRQYQLGSSLLPKDAPPQDRSVLARESPILESTISDLYTNPRVSRVRPYRKILNTALCRGVGTVTV
jgi:hypothetical protein